ncbi:MAG: replicative DNA helicase [Planctomycetota bacterium]
MATSGGAGQSAGKVSSEILDRLPPHNLDAEKGVLGSVLLNPNMCDDVALILRPEDFYADAHQKLFDHVLSMHGAGGRVDTTLLAERLKQAGDLEAVGGTAYLAEVLQSVPVASHASYYAQIVREKATLRDLIHASTEILRDAYDPTVEPREMLNGAEEKIFAVHDKRSTDHVASMQDVLIEAFEQIDKRLEKGGATGIPTGFRDLDNLTGGLHDSELVILAARPSMGKTALATNIAEHVTLDSRITCLFVSLEMARLELAQRMLCSLGKIDGSKFRSGIVNSREREKLVEISNKLSTAPLFIDDTPSRTVTEIAACARRLKRKADLGLIIVDYLQLIQPDNPKDPRQEQVAKIARRLKGLARELSIPVLCLAQLNRQADQGGKEGHRPRLSHLRESGAIEQDADVVMFVHREEMVLSREEAEGKRGEADLIVAKQRNGPTDDLKLLFFNKYTRFETPASRPHDEFDQYQEDETPEPSETPF